MLHYLETLTGSSVIAMDGEMGSVSDFLFDDQSWMIRYLAVEVGSWLNRRAVLLAITALEQPDWSRKTFRVNLMQEQVRNSHDVDTEKPVSRQQEVAMREYFGWRTDWADSEFSLLSSPPAGREYPVHTEGSRLSWKWRVRFTVKITERTREEITKALHPGREGCHPAAAFTGTGADLQAL